MRRRIALLIPLFTVTLAIGLMILLDAVAFWFRLHSSPDLLLNLMQIGIIVMVISVNCLLIALLLDYLLPNVQSSAKPPRPITAPLVRARNKPRGR